FTVNGTDNTNHNLRGQDTLPAYFGRAASGHVVISVGLPPVLVRVTAVDDHSLPLKGAELTASAGGSIVAESRTNATGQATFYLAPSANYRFAVFWEGVPVGSFLETITGAGQSFVLTADVIYPTFVVATSTGQPIPYALVTVVHPNGTVLPLEVTNASGALSLAQVPAGNYTFTVIYDDSEVVASRAVPATSDGPIPVVVAGVFTLTVKTTTSGGSALSGVFVDVVNTSTGATVASGVTGASGAMDFLLPAGTYNVTGDWSSTYDLTNLQQSVTATVGVSAATTTTLQFSKAFPAFTSTNEFFLVLGYVALVALLVLLVLLQSRRQGGKPSRSAGPVVMTPYPQGSASTESPAPETP
ncbi:MAG TPA: carboxypeptidase-like regulatory domain-containing protein, partial [Thermoplasmata archaeon]|nr:carboxypeptidase-like regulatory domain-containing protein [Thermoplasmata archaeon]